MKSHLNNVEKLLRRKRAPKRKVNEGDRNLVAHMAREKQFLREVRNERNMSECGKQAPGRRTIDLSVDDDPGVIRLVMLGNLFKRNLARHVQESRQMNGW